nr:putative ribonuclease H-like domain-containing protein [Tanacetum cinerariifolium]
MMAYSSSNPGSDNEVQSCSKTCAESYARLKKLYDEKRDKLGDTSVEIIAYTLALKKVEAQLLCHQQNQLAYEQKIMFMKIDLDDKTDVLTYHKKLLAEALKEKEDLKSKVENWQNSSKNLNRQLNTQMSANDKFGLGYGDYRYGSILSYENEVLKSVFMNKECDLENTPVNDRYAKGMHDVPSPIAENYMPSGPDVEIDYSRFTYGPKQTSADESDSKPIEYASSDSDSSVEITTSMHAPVDNAPKVVSEPKVLTDAHIIEEYESDSDDDSVSNVQENIEKPSFAFTDSVKHGNRDTAVKASEGCNWRYKRNSWNKDDPHKALKDKGIVHSGCYSNGRITGKRKIKVVRLDFEDVYYVEELKHYNLFFVSQMCDKKNKVLFIDTDYLVLYPDFKLPDENQVLLKIPSKHNMYSFNLKNIDPSGDLSCLFAKASID